MQAGTFAAKFLTALNIAVIKGKANLTPPLELLKSDD